MIINRFEDNNSKIRGTKGAEKGYSLRVDSTNKCEAEISLSISGLFCNPVALLKPE
jgi:hypothetical protein